LQSPRLDLKNDVLPQNGIALAESVMSGKFKKVGTNFLFAVTRAEGGWRARACGFDSGDFSKEEQA